LAARQALLETAVRDGAGAVGLSFFTPSIIRAGTPARGATPGAQAV